MSAVMRGGGTKHCRLSYGANVRLGSVAVELPRHSEVAAYDPKRPFEISLLFFRRGNHRIDPLAEPRAFNDALFAQNIVEPF